MQKSSGNFWLGDACIAAAAILLVSLWPATAHAAAQAPDYVLSPVPGASSTQGSDASSKFKYMFGAPAKWPSALRWYYNHAGAPAEFSNAKDLVIRQIIAESAKWTAVCGVQINYIGETDVAPRTTAGGSDGISVVGWHKPDMAQSLQQEAFQAPYFDLPIVCAICRCCSSVGSVSEANCLTSESLADLAVERKRLTSFL